MKTMHDGQDKGEGFGRDMEMAAVSAKGAQLDAGMRDLDHYISRLPKWRYSLRQFLIPIVRWETPYLALLQEKLRTPSLDAYFAFTANLGTHTFFMIMLPILFWCGYTNLGRAMVHVLASGVFWSGFVKDMLCLPRPLSPPLQRITMSGSAALEYGFPSTHSTNAVSVAVYAIQMLRTSAETQHPNVHLSLQIAFYFYAVSIVFGRLYCGMHGFFDVVIGTLLGWVLAAVQLTYGEAFDLWVCQGPYLHPLIAILVVLLLVRIHPEPADDCPCFDDSVCFAGVIIGCEIGLWHFASTTYAQDYPVPGTVPFELQKIGWIKATARIILGVLTIFAWRACMKPALLKFLPPIFRILERLRLSLPRKYFLQASQYTTVPNLRKDDNVLPPASDIPRLLTNLSHPRKRSVSVGPQSAADAYETLAYRQRKRRESLTSPSEDATKSPVNSSPLAQHMSVSSNTSGRRPLGADLLPSPAASRVHSYEQMMGAGDVESVVPLLTPPESERGGVDDVDASANKLEAEEKEDREIFMKIEKPRVRYDVEVITKLIVYSGIAWLAVEWNPILFEIIGLGMQ